MKHTTGSNVDMVIFVEVVDGNFRILFSTIEDCERSRFAMVVGENFKVELRLNHYSNLQKSTVI